MSATEMPPHGSIVFKELFDDINSTKRQQWTITNYSVLILAAIYVVNLSDYGALLINMALITAIVGSALLLRIQWHMARSRIRLDKIYKTYFVEDELKAVGLSDKEIKALGDERRWRRYLRAYRRGWEVLIVLIGVLWVGAMLVFLVYVPGEAESTGL